MTERIEWGLIHKGFCDGWKAGVLIGLIWADSLVRDEGS